MIRPLRNRVEKCYSSAHSITRKLSARASLKQLASYASGLYCFLRDQDSNFFDIIHIMSIENFKTSEQFDPTKSLNMLERARAEGKNFHGSKRQGLERLDPSLALDHSPKHGEHMKVVYAAPGDFLLPLVLSLAKPIDSKQRMGLRISEREGKIRIWSETENIQFDDTAYIYVLDPHNFHEGNHNYEVYADETVPIRQEIRVSPEVLRLMIDKGDIECDIPFSKSS